MSNESGDKLRALVVEDERVARNYLVELLDGSDLAQVTGAVGSAEEAREILLGDGRLAFVSRSWTSDSPAAETGGREHERRSGARSLGSTATGW
jgi:hypothetical protein